MSSSSINKKMKKLSKSISYPSLPYDLVLSCLARIPRSYYLSLTLVSKNFQSLLASPELYKTRSLLGLTESCLYVCLRLDTHSNPCWFTLYLKQHKKKNSTGNLLVPIPSPKFPSPQWSSIVAVDSTIYEIGGLIDETRSSRVSILDCRYHTWHEAPSMQAARHSPAANFLDGKIYVAGGGEEENSLNWMEVFDPKIQTWESLPSSGAEICTSKVYQSTQVDEKIYMYGRNGMAYDPKEGTCEAVEWMPWFASFCCVIDNLAYWYKDGEFIWCDTKVNVWRSLKGLEGLPKFVSYSCVKLADYGGNMMVLWDRYAPGSKYKEKVIWCAEIELKRCNNEEVLGKVKWFDAVLTVPKSYEFVRVLVATV
ncbi:F-box/kelch-repeat protein [Cardamine amara subsp. amara]|uniref:F-box/kelch-repeat protein n=1 Tax=Cardamine amara subsp. amara TaxID=228776 RepID=A0ABD1AA46_CARAN